MVEKNQFFFIDCIAWAYFQRKDLHDFMVEYFEHYWPSNQIEDQAEKKAPAENKKRQLEQQKTSNVYTPIAAPGHVASDIQIFLETHIRSARIEQLGAMAT